MLLLLHGIGATENDLVPLAGAFDPRLLVVSLRAPRPYQRGFAWFGLDFPAPGEVVPNVEQAHETIADLVRWLAAAPARLGADPQQVYLLGFSQGAMMSLAVLRTAPERLAGVVLHGSLVISIAGVDLVYLGLNAVLTSVETALKHVNPRQLRP